MRAVADWRAAEHMARCEHPHSDCYCGVHWNDGEAKSACGECADA